jgi:hypothetical protein
MVSRPKLLRAALIAIAAFVLLAIPWPGWTSAYARGMRGGAELGFSAVGWGEVDFEPRPASGPWVADTSIVLRDEGGNVVFGSAVPSRFVGYTPTIVFLALLIATPLGLWRWLRALFLGGILVNLYVLVRLALVALMGWTIAVGRSPNPPPHPAFLESGWWRKLLRFLVDTLHGEPTVFIVVPILIWFLVCFRSRDFSRTAEAQDRSGEGESPATGSA